MKTTISLLLLAAPSFSHAVLCANYSEKPNDPYYFVDSMFTSIKGFDTEVEKVRKSSDDKLVFTMTTSMPRMKCVIEELKPFKGSSDKMIAESAKGVSDGVGMLIENFQSQIALFKAVEDGSLQGKANISEKFGELANKIDNSWSVISLAVIGSSHTLIDEKKLQEDGKAKTLVLTEQQKKDLIKKIEKTFITKNKTKYQLEGVASAYLSFLKDKWNTKK